MKKKFISILLCIAACLFAFSVDAAVKKDTKVLVWTPKAKVFNGDPQEVDIYQNAKFAMQFAGYVKDIYNTAYNGKVNTTISIGYDETTNEVTRKELPSLDEYSLVFVLLPGEMLTDAEISQLEAYVNKGGRLVFISENNGMAREENVILSDVAKKLGADFQIEDFSFGLENKYDEQNDKYVRIQYPSERNKSSNLYAEGIEQAYAAKITYSGNAQWVYKIEDDVWVVDEAAGKGRITVVSDMNFLVSYYDKTEGIETDPTEFMKLLLEDTINNMSIVANGGNPNDDLGKGRFIAETDSPTIKISSINLSKIVPITEEEKTLIDEGVNVAVRLRVSESKEDVSKEDQKLIENTIKKEKLAMYMDVSLFKKVGDAAEEKLSVLADKMELSVELDDKFVNTDAKLNRIYKVIRTHEGKAQTLPATFDPETKTLTFETDRFSSYALVYEDVPVPNTFDSITPYAVIGGAILLAIGAYALVLSKRY